MLDGISRSVSAMDDSETVLDVGVSLYRVDDSFDEILVISFFAGVES